MNHNSVHLLNKHFLNLSTNGIPASTNGISAGGNS